MRSHQSTDSFGHYVVKIGVILASSVQPAIAACMHTCMHDDSTVVVSKVHGATTLATPSLIKTINHSMMIMLAASDFSFLLFDWLVHVVQYVIYSGVLRY